MFPGKHPEPAQLPILARHSRICPATGERADTPAHAAPLLKTLPKTPASGAEEKQASNEWKGGFFLNLKLFRLVRWGGGRKELQRQELQLM